MKFDYKKIRNEDFNKLPQLDRIELRQKIDYVNLNKSDMGSFSFLNSMLCLAGFIMLLSLGVWNINPEAGQNLFRFLILPIKIGLWGLIILSLLQIISNINFKKKLNNLYGSYFEQKVNIKKNK